jgi:hypothetical protein
MPSGDLPIANSPGNDRRIALLLVGYGEVQHSGNLASYNTQALDLLVSKFVPIPKWLYPLLLIDSVFTSGIAIEQMNRGLSQISARLPEMTPWLDEIRYIPSFHDQSGYTELVVKLIQQQIQQQLAYHNVEHLERGGVSPKEIALMLAAGSPPVEHMIQRQRNPGITLPSYQNHRNVF